MKALLLKVLAMLPLTSFSCIALSDDPARGIYVFPTKPSLQNGDYDKSLSVAGVDGAAIVLNWSDITYNAAQGYDFAVLDTWVQKIKSHHLKIEIAIRAGAGTPNWLFDIGAQKITLEYSTHRGFGTPTTFSMAPPWDPVFQQQFRNLIQSLSAHLKQIGAYNDVSIVKITGINTTTEELRLDNETPQSTGKVVDIDSQKVWKSVGYRPALVERSFQAICNSFEAAFSDKTLVLAIIPRNGFPSIDQTGQIVAMHRSQAIDVAILQSACESALASMGKHFVLQMDFLIGDKPANPIVMNLANQFNLPVAWQTNLYLGKYGEGAATSGSPGNGPVPNDKTFLAMLKNGIYPAGGSGNNAKCRFIEVFPYDAVHSALGLESAHELLVGMGPKP